MSARIEDMDRRLDNWARWLAGGRVGGLGFAAVNMLAAMGGDRGRYREASIPTSDCEGAETDAAIKTLPAELIQTIEVHYLSGLGVAAQAVRLGVTPATVRVRLCRSHGLLQTWFADQAQQRRAQRERVERVTLVARPPFVDIEPLEQKKRRRKKEF